MRPDMPLDYAVFQLTHDRTRCELHIAAKGMTYKLASGLLKPFLAHLSAAEEQIVGGGYTIRLEPPDPGSTMWFTKGTMERFVRFVSTPEALERVGAVEMELIEIEQTIRAQTTDALEVRDHSTKPTGPDVAPVNLEKPAEEAPDAAEVGMVENRKQQLSRFLDARWIMLQKEQGMAFARAIAAGFNIEQMGDLMLFADTFGATRLREACTQFMASCKKRQESGLWQEDLKLAAAETAQAEMVFNDSIANCTKDHLDLQGRGMKKHDEHRRASLPGDGRLLMGDGGLEKLTRRGSLDELTGEFWQVAARMRAAGMMDGIGTDWSSKWQMPKSGRNQPMNEEMQAGSGYMGRNSEIRETDSGPVLQTHPIFPPWQGHPQNHFMHNIHSLPLHGPLHPSLPPPLGMPMPPQPGLPYPAYHGHPYMAQAYAEANGWQMPPPIPSPYWPGHYGYNGTLTPNANEHRESGAPNQGVESNSSNNNDGNRDGPASAQMPASDLLDRKDPQEMVSTASTQVVSKDIQETAITPTPTPAGNLLVSQNVQVMDSMERQTPVSTPMPTPASNLLVSQNVQVMDNKERQSSASTNLEDCSTNESPHDVNAEPHAERTRRAPIRSSSPSRRSASPLRKVQIGRSGPKRTGMVHMRSINYITQSMQDYPERENDRASSGSWSDDNEVSKIDEEIKREPVRVRVQDVIGLFESKKDGNESNVKPSMKDNKRLPSQNSVLSRWTEPSAVKSDANEADSSVSSSRNRRGVPDASFQSTAEREYKQSNVSLEEEARTRKAEDDFLQECDRQVASQAKDEHPPAMLAEHRQDENKKQVPTDDFIIKPEGRTSSQAAESNADVELPSMVSNCIEQPRSDDSFIVFERPVVGKESISTWKMLSNRVHDVPEFPGVDCNSAQIEENFEPDDAVMVPHESKDKGSRNSDMPTDHDLTALSADVIGDHWESGNEESPATHDVHEHELGEIGDKSKTTNSKKVFNRDVKVRAMQEMLERRKAASGNRSGKPNPLAEAQLRAEKLRAYKAGLQRSKQEKEEEEKRRIEDLKSQRKERIAARSSPVGGAASQSPPTKQAPQTAALRGTKFSQTAVSQKLSGSLSSINATASAFSPSRSEIKAASTNKLPRTASGTAKANENVLSSSVPSLSELRKESLKSTLAVRSSTGSQRLSQLKKSLKDADPNSPPNANGHTEEKKRSVTQSTVRKGIPPIKDIKSESLSAAKSTKTPIAGTKQQKKLAISPKALKSSTPKGLTLGTEEVSASVEQIDATKAAAVEALTIHESEPGIDSHEISTDILENDVNKECPCASLQDDNINEHESGYVQIRAPTSTDLEVLVIADDSSRLPVESKLELGSSDETLNLVEEFKEEACNVAPVSNAEVLACTEGKHGEGDADINAGEAHQVPIAHMSPREEFSATCNEMDNKDALNVPSTIALADEYNPPLALLSLSPPHTPSKNLPRLHEAIQQAHSPEHNPGVGRSRKKGADLASQKASKDHHARGLKRLLLLGRKSHRNATPNIGDWVSVSMTSEVDDDIEDATSNAGKSMGIGPTMKNVDNRADKQKCESSSGSTSVKGSRSFFSLPNFRGRS